MKLTMAMICSVELLFPSNLRDVPNLFYELKVCGPYAINIVNLLSGIHADWPSVFFPTPRIPGCGFSLKF